MSEKYEYKEFIYKCVGCSFITEIINNLKFVYCANCEKNENNKSYLCSHCGMPLLRYKKEVEEVKA